MSAGSALVRFDGVAFDTRHGRVLDGVGFELGTGEALSVIGPNGAGKTTLLRLLVGLLAPASGTRRLGGRRYRELARDELARVIAYVPQVRPAHVPLTVEQMLLLARYPHFAAARSGVGLWRRWSRAPESADFAAVDRALAQVGIEELRPRPMDELSGGERQLVHIAAALAQDTQILVFDEPTSDLDPRHERQVTDLLRALRRERLRTVVTATHDLLFAGRVSDRVLALREGRTLMHGGTEETLTPERLEQVFDTPFRLHHHDGRPVPVVDLAPLEAERGRP